jgi:hypothetical protein
MGEACTTHGREDKCIQSLVRKPRARVHLGNIRMNGRLIRKWTFNIIMRMRELIHLVQDRDQCSAFVSYVRMHVYAVCI